MPNHVTSTVTVTGPEEALDDFRRTHLRARERYEHIELFFDFETVIPMPPILVGSMSPPPVELIEAMLQPYGRVPEHVCMKYRVPPESTTSTSDPAWRWGRSFVAWVRRNLPDVYDAARRACQCLAETGYPCWYEWSIANWGTKWNSYDGVEVLVGPGRYVFRFETAWAFPVPIFDALSQRYPSLVFDVATYDEGSCFGGLGQFNGRADFTTDRDLATPDVYLLAYGRPKPTDEEDCAEVDAG